MSFQSFKLRCSWRADLDLRINKCAGGLQMLSRLPGSSGRVFFWFINIMGEGGGVAWFWWNKKARVLCLWRDTHGTHALACTRCLKVQRRSYFNITPRELKTYIQQLNDEWILKSFPLELEVVFNSTHCMQKCQNFLVLEDVRAQTPEVFIISLFSPFPPQLSSLCCLHICFLQIRCAGILIETNSCAPLATQSSTSEISFQLLIGSPVNDLLWIGKIGFLPLFHCTKQRLWFVIPSRVPASAFWVLRESSNKCRGRARRGGCSHCRRAHINNLEATPLHTHRHTYTYVNIYLHTQRCQHLFWKVDLLLNIVKC